MFYLPLLFLFFKAKIGGGYDRTWRRGIPHPGKICGSWNGGAPLSLRERGKRFRMARPPLFKERGRGEVKNRAQLGIGVVCYKRGTPMGF